MYILHPCIESCIYIEKKVVVLSRPHGWPQVNDMKGQQAADNPAQLPLLLY